MIIILKTIRSFRLLSEAMKKSNTCSAAEKTSSPTCPMTKSLAKKSDSTTTMRTTRRTKSSFHGAAIFLKMRTEDAASPFRSARILKRGSLRQKRFRIYCFQIKTRMSHYRKKYGNFCGSYPILTIPVISGQIGGILLRRSLTQGRRAQLIRF